MVSHPGWSLEASSRAWVSWLHDQGFGNLGTFETSKLRQMKLLFSGFAIYFNYGVH